MLTDDDLFVYGRQLIGAYHCGGLDYYHQEGKICFGFLKLKIK